MGPLLGAVVLLIGIERALFVDVDALVVRYHQGEHPLINFIYKCINLAGVIGLMLGCVGTIHRGYGISLICLGILIRKNIEFSYDKLKGGHYG